MAAPANTAVAEVAQPVRSMILARTSPPPECLYGDGQPLWRWRPMGIEIERKFLVTGSGYRSGVPHHIRQGYLSLNPDRTARVRVTDDKGFITVKGRGLGVRPEFEYEIPAADANQ